MTKLTPILLAFVLGACAIERYHDYASPAPAEREPPFVVIREVGKNYADFLRHRANRACEASIGVGGCLIARDGVRGLNRCWDRGHAPTVETQHAATPTYHFEACSDDRIVHDCYANGDAVLLDCYPWWLPATKTTQAIFTR